MLFFQTLMEILININCHMSTGKAYFLFLDAKVPPDSFFHKQYGSYWLPTSWGNGMTCTFALCIYWLKNNAKMYVRIRGKEREKWPGSKGVPHPPVYVPFLYSICQTNSPSQLSDSPQELSLASCRVQKMWWPESIWMSKQEPWGQMLWETLA